MLLLDSQARQADFLPASLVHLVASSRQASPVRQALNPLLDSTQRREDNHKYTPDKSYLHALHRIGFDGAIAGVQRICKIENERSVALCKIL